MTTQHTPGPWAISKPIGGNVYIEKGNRLIGHIYRDNREANARLIAAVPDLLAACKAIIGLGSVPTTQPEYRMLCEAIDKATGGVA